MTGGNTTTVGSEAVSLEETRVSCHVHPRCMNHTGTRVTTDSNGETKRGRCTCGQRVWIDASHHLL